MDQTEFLGALRARGIEPVEYDLRSLRSESNRTAEMVGDLNQFDSMILVGIRNPNPQVSGPMIWVVLVPADTTAEPLVHRVQSGVPASEIVAERIDQVRMIYDITSKPRRMPFEKFVQIVNGRLGKGYTVENLLRNEVLIMRVVFELGRRP